MTALQTRLGLRWEQATIRGFATNLAWGLISAAAFVAANTWKEAEALVLVYMFGLVRMAAASRWRAAFYPGFLAGFIIAAGQLSFFWTIFGFAAVPLWVILAFWTGLFVALARLCLREIPQPWAWIVIPFLWTGLEFFRSELYYLRFAWLTPGYTVVWDHSDLLGLTGVYGAGFFIAAGTLIAAWLWNKSRSGGLATLVVGVVAISVVSLLPTDKKPTVSPQASRVRIAGVQLEFPTEHQVLTWLNEIVRRHPDTDLLVLSEYAFKGPIPDRILAWCRTQRKHLIVGGCEPLRATNFFNTAFVVGPEGTIVFRQSKAVPIQFFKDGMPAPEQEVWNSPWGKIGICICYDLSYTRVTDKLVRQGAQALIVPTMDIADWGRRQHELHARVAPARAAEYQIPVFRLASSGISQSVDRRGRVLGAAPYPGDGAILTASVALDRKGQLPADRWLVLPACGIVLLSLCWFVWRWSRPEGPGGSPTAPVAFEAVRKVGPQAAERKGKISLEPQREATTLRST
jgi:apolipoprotein N-acyltransferase